MEKQNETHKPGEIVISAIEDRYDVLQGVQFCIELSKEPRELGQEANLGEHANLVLPFVYPDGSREVIARVIITEKRRNKDSTWKIHWHYLTGDRKLRVTAMARKLLRCLNQFKTGESDLQDVKRIATALAAWCRHINDSGQRTLMPLLPAKVEIKWRNFMRVYRDQTSNAVTKALMLNRLIDSLAFFIRGDLANHPIDEMIEDCELKYGWNENLANTQAGNQ